jgi:hypothetical protein
MVITSQGVSVEAVDRRTLSVLGTAAVSAASFAVLLGKITQSCSDGVLDDLERQRIRVELMTHRNTLDDLDALVK